MTFYNCNVVTPVWTTAKQWGSSYFNVQCNILNIFKRSVTVLGCLKIMEVIISCDFTALGLSMYDRIILAVTR